MRRMAVPAGVLLLASCSWPDGGPDWLMAESRSPDGERVARLWCEDFCDIPERATLTISPASQVIALDRSRQGPLHPYAEGRLPEEDAVHRVWAHDGSDGVAVRLHWRNARTLVVEASCLSDGNYRPILPWRSGNVWIVPVSLPSPTPCPGSL